MCPTTSALPKDRGPCAGVAGDATFPIPTCISQSKMLQGMMVPALKPYHREPYKVSACFQAQVVPFHTGLSSQEG